MIRRTLIPLTLAACVLLAIGGGSTPAATDRDCGDFSSQAAAQDFFLDHGGPERDPHRLDWDENGVACEDLPAPYRGLLTLDYDRGDSAFEGRVLSAKKSCRRGRTVTVYQDGKSGRERVGRDDTGRQGRFRLPSRQQAGDYFATARADRPCRNERSETLSVSPVVSDSPRPNVIVVMTDDQTLAQMKALPQTKRLLGDQGTTFANYFTTQPQCCPSRASYLTGQYPHNTGVRDNSPPNGGFEAFRDAETLPVWLDRAGYRTMHIGKYLNGYPRRPRYVPPGWDRWNGLNTTLKMYDYTLNEDGRTVEYGSLPSDYATDVYARKGRAFIRAAAADGEPFYLNVAANAPHLEGRLGDCAEVNPRPAPRHIGAFALDPLPKPPSYDEEDVSDKPEYIRQLPRISPEVETCIERRWRSALASLLAVDDMVATIDRTLHEAGELSETVVVFTSDNGYFYGEHRFPTGKNQFFEEATHLPLLIRGPGFPQGATANQLAANIDLAPTILDLTGAQAGHPIDGRSLVPLANDPTQGRDRDLLIEARELYASIRTDRWLFSANQNAENQLYDLEADPFELRSLHEDPAYEGRREELRERLQLLERCVGESCR